VPQIVYSRISPLVEGKGSRGNSNASRELAAEQLRQTERAAGLIAVFIAHDS
jgi:hypothetical protein